MPLHRNYLGAKTWLMLCFLLFVLGGTIYAKPLQTPKLTEEQKITKLIQYIEKSNAVFIRNGAEGSALDAAKHLRMKREKAGKRIKTAKEFIDHIASKSSMTGEPYKMKFANGTIMPVRDVLYYELKKLE
jgi:hypothetical protein